MIYHTLSNKPYDLQSTITHLQWKAKTQRSRNCTHTGHHASQDCQQTACAGDKSMVVGCISSVWWLVVVGRLDLWYHKNENLLSAGHSGFIMDELLRNISHWTSRPQSICGKSSHPNVSASVDKIRKLSVESNIFSVHPPPSLPSYPTSLPLYPSRIFVPMTSHIPPRIVGDDPIKVLKISQTNWHIGLYWVMDQ